MIAFSRWFTRKLPAFGLSCLVAASVIPGAQATEYNPNFFFMVEGQPIGARSLVLGDPEQWYSPVAELPAASASGKVKVSAVKLDKIKGLQIDFSKSSKYGVWTLAGINGNFAPYKDKAALVLDLKVTKRPNKYVNLGLQCGEDCSAQVDIGSLLDKMKRGQLMSLPVALNCFKGDKFDLSAIQSLNLGTDAPFSITIANIRLESLPAGDTGCAK